MTEEVLTQYRRASFDPNGERNNRCRGGRMNLLTSGRLLFRQVPETAINSCLVEICKWEN